MTAFKAANNYYSSTGFRTAALDMQVFNLKILPFALPTGGEGRILIYIIGFLLLLTTALGIVMMKQKKHWMH